MGRASCSEEPDGGARQSRRTGAAVAAIAKPPRDRQRLRGWLVIGATGRGSGKSALACAVIAKLHRLHPLVGVKVTAITDEGAACPRGRDGCGACTSLEGEFEVREEDASQPGKDTARMLQSGARRAFWVRCRSGGTLSALAALAPLLDRGTLVVAESNSLAAEARPDLFLMVRPAGAFVVKPTAEAVLPHAQRMVVSVDRAFDLDLRHLVVVDGEWHLAEASAVILAGGASARMGQDKSLVLVDETPLIQRIWEQLSRRFDEVLISTNEPEKYAFLPARSVSDPVPGRGPLMGIRTALEAARHDRLFVTACDVPDVDQETVDRMLVLADDFECVVPRSPFGPEPLFAVYRRGALPAMREVLDSGEGRISAVFPRVRTGSLDLGPAPWYRNLNTAADLAAYLARRSGSHDPEHEFVSAEGPVRTDRFASPP